MAVNIQLRRGLASEWTAANPTLMEGELGYETDTGLYKVGTGSAAWNALSYNGLYGTATLAQVNINAGTDIGADVVSGDKFAVYDASAGANRTVSVTRISNFAAQDDQVILGTQIFG